MQHCGHSYKVLGLDHTIPNITAERLKAAYHVALLRNHPDKLHGRAPVASHSRNASQVEPEHAFSIDEIVVAYRTLLNSVHRVAHNADLEETRVVSLTRNPDSSSVHLGVETYDLDDLTFVERTGKWHKQCRCGNDQGYVLEEAELEAESKSGEIYVGCGGCSLFIKVLFEVVDEAEGEKDPRR